MEEVGNDKSYHILASDNEKTIIKYLYTTSPYFQIHITYNH